MSESSHLAGRVWKRSLPVLEKPTLDAPNLKRLTLPQGELAQFYNADEPVRYIAMIELRAGSVRGNHYHQQKIESVYVLQGEMSLLVQDVHSKARDTLALKPGDLVTIQPGVAHAMCPLGPGQAIEFSQVRFDPADTHRFPVTGVRPVDVPDRNSGPTSVA